ncbi:hypothetical protein J6590_009430 [Homalodisca vitripennis]|nr:hypothetical protein J6590_009430 [Homalodisca vitripennis]
MLNLYKSMSRQQQADRSDLFTGHDRFVEIPRVPRRRKRLLPLGPRSDTSESASDTVPTHRAQSASEFNPRSLREARSRAGLYRSASTEERGSAPQVVNSLTRLFSCVSVASTDTSQRPVERRPGAAPRYEIDRQRQRGGGGERVGRRDKTGAAAGKSLDNIVGRSAIQVLACHYMLSWAGQKHV